MLHGTILNRDAFVLDWDHVMHRFRGLSEELFDVPRGLADAVLVLDQRDANEALAVFAEAEPGRDSDARLLDQQLGELDRAELPRTARAPAPRRTSSPAAAGMFQPARPKLSTRQSRRLL